MQEKKREEKRRRKKKKKKAWLEPGSVVCSFSRPTFSPPSWQGSDSEVFLNDIISSLSRHTCPLSSAECHFFPVGPRLIEIFSLKSGGFFFSFLSLLYLENWREYSSFWLYLSPCLLSSLTTSCTMLDLGSNNVVLKRAIVMWLRSLFLPAVLCGLQQANFTVTGAKIFGLLFALCLCCYFLCVLGWLLQTRHRSYACVSLTDEFFSSSVHSYTCCILLRLPH